MPELLSVRRAMLVELDDEESRTLRTLERVPQERWTWAPHERSMPMGRLAAHVASLGQVAVSILTTRELDLSERRAQAAGTPQAAGDLVPAAQGLFHQVRTLLGAAGDPDLDVDWTFRFGDHVLFGPGPRALALRTFYLSHLIHHRAQLGVYLRLCGVPVPGTYGPSADEPLA